MAETCYLRLNLVLLAIEARKYEGGEIWINPKNKRVRVYKYLHFWICSHFCGSNFYSLAHNPLYIAPRYVRPAAYLSIFHAKPTHLRLIRMQLACS